MRYHRRSDGAILTADCPVGLRRKRVRLLAAAGTMTALAAGVAGPFAHLGALAPPSVVERRAQAQPIPVPRGQTPPPPIEMRQGEVEMGDIAPPHVAEPTPRGEGFVPCGPEPCVYPLAPRCDDDRRVGRCVSEKPRSARPRGSRLSDVSVAAVASSGDEGVRRPSAEVRANHVG